MADLMSSISSFLKIDDISIDNNVFRLHYKVTAVLLVGCSLLVTEKQYLGDPIDCITDKVPSELMDSYCWIHSTYTIPELSEAVIGVDVPHPGIAPPNTNYERHYHKYYQWVTLVLFFQAMLFCVPRYLWQTWEGKRMKHLVMQLNLPVIDDSVKESRKLVLVDYYMKNLRSHNQYAQKFFSCEILNLANVLFQIWFTDLFLGHEFSTYGTRVLEFTQEKLGARTDPMDEVFPKVTKCTFHKYGYSGTIQRVDGLCVLPINVLNEKIYIVLWFWFIILAVISGCGLFYRIGTLFPRFRKKLLESRCKLVEPEIVEEVCRMCDIGDWFILFQLGKNMDSLVFSEVMELLAEESRNIYSTESKLEDDELPLKESSYWNGKRAAEAPTLRLRDMTKNNKSGPD